MEIEREIGRPATDVHPLVQGIRNAALDEIDGIKMLMIAVLDRSLTDLSQGLSRSRSYRSMGGTYSSVHGREAAAWILSDTNNHLFSFVNVCANLNLDPDAVRNKIFNMRWL